MELIETLVSQLGITSEQAQGGAGSLLQLAKDKLGDQDFSQLANQIPGLDGIIGAAPETGQAANLVGGLASAVGIDKDLGGLAKAADGFKKLGLDTGMVAKFVPILLSFVRSKGGDTIAGMLEGVLK